LFQFLISSILLLWDGEQMNNRIKSIIGLGLGLFLIAVVFQNCSGNIPMSFENTNLSSEVNGRILKKDSVSITPNQSLVVDSNSHLVVMQYMPWFGPNAFSFDKSPVTPELSSGSMTNYLFDVLNLSAGGLPQDHLNFGGYDSSDRNVIRTHIQWLKSIGVHAILLDHSNQIVCTFADVTETECGRENYLASLAIKQNVRAIYEEFAAEGSIKIIPLLGADSSLVGGNNIQATDNFRGKIALLEQSRFFKDLMYRYPNVNVVYEGKPLQVIFLAVESAKEGAIRQVLAPMNSEITIRIMGGFFESQPHVNNGIGREGLKKVPFWSWWDRYNPQAGLMPTYADSNGRVEAFTAVTAVPSTQSAKTALKKQSKSVTKPYVQPSESESGFGVINWESTSPQCFYRVSEINNCPPPTQYLPGVRKYQNGETLASYFQIAKKIQPTFLFVHQFNGFVIGDSGVDIETSTDLEPTVEWGHSRLFKVAQLIADYKNALPPATTSTPVVSTTVTTTPVVRPTETNTSAGALIGFVDPLADNKIRGWACEQNLESPYEIHVYIGGESSATTPGFLARQRTQAEPAVQQACKAGGDLRWELPIDAQFMNTYAGKKIYAYIVKPGGRAAKLSNSGVFTVPTPSPTSGNPGKTSPEIPPPAVTPPSVAPTTSPSIFNPFVNANPTPPTKVGTNPFVPANPPPPTAPPRVPTATVSNPFAIVKQPASTTTPKVTTTKNVSTTSPFPETCQFGKGSVSDKASVTAYLSQSVSYGQTCRSQIRTCNAGKLSGSYIASTCTVQAPKNCVFAGAVVEHGKSVTAFRLPIAKKGQKCQQQTRTCSNGILSGSFGSRTCQ
jgi:hypothetical protein